MIDRTGTTTWGTKLVGPEPRSKAAFCTRRSTRSATSIASPPPPPSSGRPAELVGDVPAELGARHRRRLLLVQELVDPARRIARADLSSAATGTATACSGSAASRCASPRSTALGAPSTRRSARDSVIGASWSASLAGLDSHVLHPQAIRPLGGNSRRWRVIKLTACGHSRFG